MRPKGGVRLLTKSVALYGARLSPQVRCDSVHPAFLEGAMIDGIAAATSHPDGARARMTRNVPLGRLGTRAEVAAHRLPVVRRVFVTGGESPSTAGSQFAVIVLRRPREGGDP